MGGGSGRKKHPNKVRNRKERENMSLPFPENTHNGYKITSQSSGSIQAGYVSDHKPDSYLEDNDQNKLMILFIAICRILMAKYRKEKNKKQIDFLNKLDKIEILNKENLINTPEFKDFKKYCKNISIQQYDGFDIARKFLTKYFQDSFGVFMKMKKEEWVQYINNSSENKR